MDNRTLVGLNYLLHYPEIELYRLFVDGKLHSTEKGWEGYESRERGCVKANFRALSVVLKRLYSETNKQSILDVDFIKELHRACLSNVENKNQKITEPGNFRDPNIRYGGPFYFGLAANTTTIDGLTQILDMIENSPPKGPRLCSEFYFAGCLILVNSEEIKKCRQNCNVGNNKELAEKILPDINRVHFIVPSAAYVAEAMNAITKSYNTAILNATTNDEKLRVIVNHIQQYEQLHPFTDGNIRAFAVFLLNYLLMQNGFPPATLFEPNIFDGHSVDELVNEVRKGMEVTHDILGGVITVYHHTTEPSERYNLLVNDFKILRSSIPKNKAPLEPEPKASLFPDNQIHVTKIKSQSTKAPLSPEIKTLISKIESQIDIYKTRIHESSQNLQNLESIKTWTHKIEILMAAKLYLKGEDVNLKEVEKQFPRCRDGDGFVMKSETTKLLNEVEEVKSQQTVRSPPRNLS